ncbi:alpha/beta hydrolase [Noviherbaspirillum sp.]|uniref:alpha/beta hydrolase n=1 Tax=Noviherbaspirillum sp. TaxID=1926288 RepID=UPI002D491F71|nr:alpha/beta hydrolase [Noviherbaspirillum sp.]HZW23341.1 alpha/beta hydrolase [Noviherbaspirillum sp.]
MTGHHQYTPEELERQYNVRLARPDFESVVIPGWTARSAGFRAGTNAKLDLAYGAQARERLDVFSAGGAAAAPAIVFFHGGYWQRFDKSVFSFIAEPFVRRGVSVVLPNYALCPTVRIGKIPEQARRAVAWVWRNASELGIDRNRIFVMGHSAGGHITAMLMATRWAAVAPALPSDLVKGGIPISGLFELEPLRHTSINRGLGLDEEEAANQSPMNHEPATCAPQLVVCGGKESAEFHRQSDVYVQAFATKERRIERFTVPWRDHMDVLDDLSDENAAFFQKVHALVTA